MGVTFSSRSALFLIAAFTLSLISAIPVGGAAGTPVAVNDSLIMYEDSGPVTINWINNDDMDDNATLDSFDAVSTNGGTVTDNGDGTFDFDPVMDFSGGDGFTYTICDDDTPTPECDTASVSVTVVATSTCLTGFYQTLSGEIHILDTTTSPASYVSVATDIGELNATGYNPNDGLIYGFSSNLDQIVSFDPNTGVFTNVFAHTEDAPFAGDFDSSDNLWYNRSTDTVLYRYNSSSDTRTSITLNTSHGVADFAYVPSTGLFYGVQSNGDNLAVINTGTATVTTLATSGPITSETGGFGATWVTGNTTLFAFNNASGNIFSIDTTTGVSTSVGTSAPNGSNDGMSCAAGTDPFSVSSILDYGDAPDSYSTLSASSGASAVVNTSYRIGNFNELEADGVPSAGADGDDANGVGDDEDGVRVGVTPLSDAIIYEGESNTVLVDVPLNAGVVSLWIDQNDDGDFDAGEQFATDVAPSGGVATLTFTPGNTTSSVIDTYARVRLAARTGGGPTGLFSFGEIEDYTLSLYPSRPTITNDALATVSAANESNYSISGTCTDNGDPVDVSVTDGSNTIDATQTTCMSGTFNVTVDISTLADTVLTVTSIIDDGINEPVMDVDTVTKDATGPSITVAPQADISAANEGSYEVSGTCFADGDVINVTITDSAPSSLMEATTCSSGVYSTTFNASSFLEGTVTVESEIDDGVNPAVTTDIDVQKDTVGPTIFIGSSALVTSTNATQYPVSGFCTTDSDAIAVTAASVLGGGADTVLTSCQGGLFSVKLDLSTFTPGDFDVRATIDDGVNPQVYDEYTTNIPANLDDDDTPSSEEQAGPNDGDGNNDGIQDHLQDNVTTKVNDVIGAYTTTEASGSCSEFKAVRFFAEGDLATQDDTFDYLLGLHGFEVDCLAPGGTINVTYYWDKAYDTSNWSYRKYLENSNEYIDFNDQVTYGVDVVAGKTVTTVSFSVVDGGPYDGDGLANGVIVDPAGPVVLGSLAETGTAAWIPTAAGASLLVMAAVLQRSSKPVPSRR